MMCLKLFSRNKRQPSPKAPPIIEDFTKEHKPNSIFEASDEDSSLHSVTLTSSGYDTEVTDPDAPSPPKEEDQGPRDPEIIRIHRECPQFRVLIIGRANSGKTTIIQKICETKENPIVRDKNGKTLPSKVLCNPDAMRGTHDVELEITYRSNPGFIFHDSMALEAGSGEELQKVRKFINDKLDQHTIQERLHVIWYCIPTDSPRVAFPEELKFFEQNTGNIPVILVFTKWDGQIVRACNSLQQAGMSLRDAKKAAPEYARKIFEEHYLPVFQNTRYPPKSYLLLGNMHKEETRCTELVQKTSDALDNSALKKLWISTQTHNIELRVDAAVDAIVKEVYVDKTIERNSSIVVEVFAWFPHLWCDFDYDLGWGCFVKYGWFGEDKGKKGRKRFPPLFHSIFAISHDEFQQPHHRTLHTIAAAIIVAHSSFNPQRRARARSVVKPTVRKYVRSQQRQVVKKAILERFPTPPTPEQADYIREELRKICMSNLVQLPRKPVRQSSELNNLG